MATVLFTQFLPEVLPAVPGCPDIVAVNAIRNAAVDFCTRTLAWAERQDDVAVSSTDVPLELEAPNGAAVIKVLSVKADGRKLRPTTQDELDAASTGWETATGAPLHYFQPDPTQLALHPIPQSACALRLRVAYAPTRAATGCAKFLYDDHLETIAAGALARLLTKPGQPWANPELGAAYGQGFANQIREAQSAVQRDLVRAAPRVRMNPF